MADDRLMQARKRRPATLQELGGAEVTQFKAMPAAFLNAGARGFDHPTSPPAPDRFLKKQQGLGGRGIQKHKLALAGLHNNPTPTPTPDTQMGRGEEVAAERLERGIAPSKHTLWRRMYERRDFPLRVEHKGRNSVHWTRTPTDDEIKLWLPLFVEGCEEENEPHRFVAYAGSQTLIARFQRKRGPRGPLCRCAQRAAEGFLKLFRSESLVTNAVGLDVFILACETDDKFATAITRGPKRMPGMHCRLLVSALGKLTRVDARRCHVDMGYGRGRSVHVADAAARALNLVRLGYDAPMPYPERLDFQATAAGVPLPPRPRTAYGVDAPLWERDVLVTRSVTVSREVPRRPKTALRRSWPSAPYGPTEDDVQQDDDDDRTAFVRRSGGRALPSPPPLTNVLRGSAESDSIVQMGSPGAPANA